MPAARSKRRNARQFAARGGCARLGERALNMRKAKTAPLGAVFALQLEAEVGIEPAYTALQAAA